MFKIIQNLPKNVLGIEAHGKITDADYRKVLIPRADEMLAKYPAIRMLYVAGKDFKGYDVRATWDDTVFGLKHWSKFSCVVIVTDVEWLRTAAHLFSPFFPGVVKVFDLADITVAKSWVVEGKTSKKKNSHDAIKREIILPIIYNIQDVVNTEEKRLDKGVVRVQRKQKK